MNVAIIGGRDFDDFELLESILVSSIDLSKVSNIVSGGAKGADRLAEMFAEKYELEMIIHKADWKLHGRGAGIIRNEHIIKDSDMIFAFWDGKSKGTQNSILRAQRLNKKLHIIYYNQGQKDANLF